MSLTYNVMCACVPFIDDDKVIVIGSDFTPARNGVKDTFYSDFKGRKILTDASTAEYIGEVMNIVRS